MRQSPRLDGKYVFDRDVGPRTVEEVRVEIARRQLVDLERRRIFVRQGSELTPLENAASGSIVSEFKTLPKATIKAQTSSVIAATSRRSQFILAQVAELAEVLGERFGQTVQLDYNLRFALLPRFRLPFRWGARMTPILIWFPPNYPDMPPHGFYLSKRCQGPHIFSRNPYGDSPDLSAEGWNWFCLNLGGNTGGGWVPNADPHGADNLWTVLDAIRAALSIDEF